MDIYIYIYINIYIYIYIYIVWNVASTPHCVTAKPTSPTSMSALPGRAASKSLSFLPFSSWTYQVWPRGGRTIKKNRGKLMKCASAGYP